MSSGIKSASEQVAPVLYEINTRVWLSSLSPSGDCPIPLEGVPDQELDRWVSLGIDWIWLLGTWSAGPAARELARTFSSLRAELQDLLPDLRETDIDASCFALQSYTVPEASGGDRALAKFRERLHERGLRLMLDFVPNHTGVDHPWVRERPEYYVHGTPADWASRPGDFARFETVRGPAILAHGRDPWFPSWRDTVQLDYAEPALVQVMSAELLRIASACDGLRCDMAMLILPEVFERTWGIRALPFWPEAIRRVKRVYPDFLFLAEVYWDLERTLQQLGFDYTYDKGLYDRLRQRQPAVIREHLQTETSFQHRLARFLENHDEPRAAATYPPDIHRAAAILTFLSPGLKLFHQGQFEGCRSRLPVQLVRAPREAPDPELADFYGWLLQVLHLPAIRRGRWQSFECHPAWEGNWTWDCVVAFGWEGPDARWLVVAVNYSDHQSQARVEVAGSQGEGRTLDLADLRDTAREPRRGVRLTERGLYLDLPPWGYEVLEGGGLSR